MSKSYNNTLPLFGDVKAIRKQIMRIVTDTRPMEDPKDPETDHLFQLYRLFASSSDVESMAAMYRRGGFGYGDVKKAWLNRVKLFLLMHEPSVRTWKRMWTTSIKR